MPRSSGVYIAPTGNPVIAGEIITDTWANNLVDDIGQALTNSIANDGQTVVAANLPMNGFRHTGVMDAVSATDYASYGQLLAIKALIAVDIFTHGTGVTFRRDPATKIARITAIGGGGSGGGAAATDGTHISLGSGGGGGGTCTIWCLPGVTELYTVGNGASGNAGANGSAGGMTSFGTWISANGGYGGITATQLAAANLMVAGADGGDYGIGAPSVAFGVKGGTGGRAFSLSVGFIWTAGGGSSSLGSGAPPFTISSSNGLTADNYGGGGGGAVNAISQGAKTGGAGGGGLLIIEQFS